MDTTGFADIDKMCERLKTLYENGNIAEWCETRIRAICDSLHAARPLLDDARAERDALRKQLDEANARVAGLDERLGWQAENVMKIVDEQTAALRADNERLREALEKIKSESYLASLGTEICRCEDNGIDSCWLCRIIETSSSALAGKDGVEPQ